jgi:hypothetical protein
MAKENTPGQMGITTRAAIRMGKEKASERWPTATVKSTRVTGQREWSTGKEGMSPHEG